MVGYGSQLLKARRPGWEITYLDYDEMKHLLHEINDITSKFCGISGEDLVFTEETSLLEGGFSRDHSNSQNVENCQAELKDKSEQFLELLRKEVEKVSLYAISRQGELADAIGCLRFHNMGQIDQEGNEVGQKLTLSNHADVGNLLLVSDNDTDDKILTTCLSSAAEETLVDDLSALLPSFTTSTTKSITTLLKGTRPMFQGSGVFSSPSASIISKTSIGDSEGQASIPDYGDGDTAVMMGDGHTDDFTVVAVELLHLLRYICINVMAVRKIIKKYEKAIQKCSVYGLDLEMLFPENDEEEDEVESRFISPLSNHDMKQYYDKHYEQLQVIATSESMKALTASIVLASNTKISREFFDYPITSRMKNESSLRFKCAIDCIDILQEYAEVVNQNFPAFLSRQAMIITGQELGNLGGRKARALEVILRFDPDTILRMDKSELIQWQQKCWKFSHGVGTRLRSTSFSSLENEDFSYDKGPLVWGGCNSVSMYLNLISLFLYTTNYYIVSPTANRYAILLGSKGEFGSTLIGAASFAAFFGGFLYSWWYTCFSFKSALVFSSFLSVLGNLLYAVAISFHSIKIAFIGRMLVGLGSAEVINRQIISSCVRFNSMTRASASFVVASALGMSVGPLLAAILDDTSGRDIDIDSYFPQWVPHLGGKGIIFNNVTSPAFVMAIFWFIEFLFLMISFEEPIRINSFKKGDDQKRQGWFSELVAIKDLLFSNVALPITLLIYGYIEMVDEILLSSCAMVCKRYFLWNGSIAGYILAALGSLVLPADFIVDRASRFYEERFIIKYSLFFICIGLFIMINYQGLFQDLEILDSDIGEIASNFTDSEIDRWFQNDAKINSTNDVYNVLQRGVISEPALPYDWNYGAKIYLFSLSFVFMGTVVLEGVDTSLLSISAPTKLNSTFLSVGLLTTLMGTIGRCVGDFLITLSAIVDNLPFTDFVNSTFAPVIPITMVGMYLVTKHFKSLTYDK